MHNNTSFIHHIIVQLAQISFMYYYVANHVFGV
jgi:hypothetical protein